MKRNVFHDLLAQGQSGKAARAAGEQLMYITCNENGKGIFTALNIPVPGTMEDVRVNLPELDGLRDIALFPRPPTHKAG